MKYLKSILFSVYVILIILLLLNNCNGCQNHVTNSGGTQMISPIMQPIDSAIVEPVDSVEDETIERADTIGHDGKLKITLLWDFPADIDLHVEQPNGFEIYYKNEHKKDSQTGGFLDVDNQTGGRGSAENIYWENPPQGEYVVSLVYYKQQTGGEEGGICTVVVKREINGHPQTESYRTNMHIANKEEKVYITRFTTQ